MRILLTGADGFTGRHFQAAALRAGHEVVPLRANLRDQEGIRAEVRAAAPEAVVHLAAISFVGHADDAAFYAVNVVGTTHLLAALATLPRQPRAVLLASSANIYGNCETSPIPETQPAAPVNHYAASKMAMEHMALTWRDRLPLVIARPFNYTGAGQAKQFLIPKMVDHFVRGAASIALGNLHVEREFNDVRTVCSAYLQLLDHGQPGQAYNICSGQPHALLAVMQALRSLTGHTMAVEVNPDFVRPNEVLRLCGDPGKLLACTGPLPDYTLQDTLQWMLESGKGP
jgi:GDP-6-deoxy-D-talose 4-dehydrogenase